MRCYRVHPISEQGLMPGIKTDFLFKIALEVPVLALGETPYGGRRIARFAGGSFETPDCCSDRCRPISISRCTDHSSRGCQPG